jgi:hypothetical protein
MTHITFVKKILVDGTPCKKCRDVSERLKRDGLLSLIDNIAIADERDPDSQGILLAKQYQVNRAPFFLIKDDIGQTTVYDIYFKFKKAIEDSV